MRRSKQSVTRILLMVALLVGSLAALVTSVSAVPSNPLGNNVAMQNTPGACQAGGAGPGTGETCLDIRITSSDPDLASRMATGTTVRLVEGTRVEFNGTLSGANLQLPRTLSFSNTSDFGTYTLTINSGDNFEPFSANYTVNQRPDQVLNVVLQVDVDDPGDDLVDRLVEVLKRILRDILGNPTPTAVPPTATSVPATQTPGGPTATAVPPTSTAVPPTATTVPPADFVSFNFSASPDQLQTGQTTTFTATLSGRTGPAGAVLTIGVSDTVANLDLDEFACSPNCVAQDTNPAQFNLGPNMNYTRTFTFEGTSDVAGSYTVTVTANDTTSDVTATRSETVTFVAPTPTAVPPTATAVPPTSTSVPATSTAIPPETVGPLNCVLVGEEVDDIAGCTTESMDVVTGTVDCDGTIDDPGTCTATVVNFGEVAFDDCATTLTPAPADLRCESEEEVPDA